MNVKRRKRRRLAAARQHITGKTKRKKKRRNNASDVQLRLPSKFLGQNGYGKYNHKKVVFRTYSKTRQQSA